MADRQGNTPPSASPACLDPILADLSDQRTGELTVAMLTDNATFAGCRPDDDGIGLSSELLVVNGVGLEDIMSTAALMLPVTDDQSLADWSAVAFVASYSSPVVAGTPAMLPSSIAASHGADPSDRSCHEDDRDRG